MIRFVVLFSALILVGCVSPHSAAAWVPKGSPNTLCPNGTQWGDGCLTANAASTYTTTAATDRLSGQTWTSTHPWPWNAAAYDFPVGYYTALGSLLDPATASLPSGCTYSATGHGGFPIMTCQSVTGLTILGFNFGPVGGHDCTFLDIKGNVGGSILVTDNAFQNDSTNLGGGCGQNNGSLGTVETNTTAVSFTASYNTFDGQAATNTATMIAQFTNSCTSCTNLFEYNASLHPPGRVFGSGPNTTFLYNYALGICEVSCPSPIHGEFNLSGSSTVNYSLTAKFNVVVYTAASTGNTTTFFCSSGSTSTVTGTCDIENNIVIVNYTTNVSAALFEMSWSQFGNVTVKTNYVDLTGVGAGGYCNLNAGGLASAVNGSMTGGVLTVTSLTGLMTPGMDNAGFQETMANGGITSGTQLISQLSGTTGSTGTYSVSGSQTVASVSNAITQLSPINGTYTNSGNVNLLNGNAINSLGVHGGSAGCN